MRFSILIPAYNVQSFIKQCIESVLTQSFSDFEIIIVDDGSTDKTGTICDCYSSRFSFIKVIHKTNQGLLWARRDAIKLASGEYCLFIDSDDFYTTKASLQTINDALHNFGDPDVLIFEENRFLQDGSFGSINPAFSRDYLFRSESIQTIRAKFLMTDELNNLWKKCVKTHILKADETDYRNFPKNNGEDLAQSFFIFDKAESVGYIKNSVYSYRVNPASITMSNCEIRDIIFKINPACDMAKEFYQHKWGLLNRRVQRARVSYTYFTLYVALSTLIYAYGKSLTKKPLIDDLFSVDIFSVLPTKHTFFIWFLKLSFPAKAIVVSFLKHKKGCFRLLVRLFVWVKRIFK
jgi:glycosyltransferase involved in cell wall biosynthesis